MESTIEHYGYLAVLIGTFLEGETVLILGGFAAHRGYLELPWVIVSAFAGTVCGDQLFYLLGRKHSEKLLSRRPAWKPKIAKAQALISRHRIVIIICFRFIYGLRTAIPFALGAAAVPGRIFMPLNILGALLWSVAIGAAGYVFGQTLETVFGRLKHLELWIMAGIAILGLLVWVIRLRRSRHNHNK